MTIGDYSSFNPLNPDLPLCIYVVPAHQTSDMSRSTISPESRSRLEMVILSSLRFRTIWTFQYDNFQFMCPDFNKH